MASGRWHTSPRPIVYCSDEPHTAYCEILRQFIHPFLMPDDIKLLKIAGLTLDAIETVRADRLGNDWDDDAHGWRVCRPVGDAWLNAGRILALKVPSAARLGSYNYLINPRATRASELSIVEVIDQPFAEYITRGNPRELP